MNGSDVLDGPQQQLVCVVQLPIALAAEQVRAAWARALDSDPLAQPCYSRAKCGEVEQRQCMRTIVSFALAGKPLTQQLANHVNGSMGTAFIPSALPALARVFQDVLREEAHIRPTSVAVVEAAYSLTA
jgi:hypothetical protein